MIILGLDLGTKTGWAAGDSKDFPDHLHLIYSGVEDLGLKRDESLGMRFLRFSSLLKRIRGVFYEFDLVLYEMPHQRGGPSTRLLLGMVGVLLELCEVWDVNYKSVHSASLKKFATGSGRASKKDMVKVAEKKFKREIERDDEADALLLWLWGRENYGL